MSYLDLVRRAAAQRRADATEASTPRATTSDVEAILSLPLDRFAVSREIIEIRVPYLDVTLFFVSSEEEISRLCREGIGRGRIWTAGELIDVLSIPGLTRADVVTVATAKLFVDGEVESVVPYAKNAKRGGKPLSETHQREKR